MENIEELIRQVHAQWRLAKEQAARECDSRSLVNVAGLYRTCDLFKGTEDIGSLVALLTSPQGSEFCLRYRFPNLATFRLFKSYKPEQFGVYIDTGQIELHNPRRAVLVGRTSATISCDTLERHEITLFQGASATINASGWAVVSVQGVQGARVIKNVSGNAIIL